LFTLHWKIFCPTPRPLIDVELDVGDAIVALPLTSVHVPVAGPMRLLPLSVVLLPVEQRFWSAPALAEGLVFVTSFVLIGLAHGPLVIVQRNTFAPTPSAVTVVVGEEAVVIVPLPLINVHVPVEGAVGALPASVALFVGKHLLWSGPAFAIAAPALNTVIVI
jgi:hypothetical protein